MDESVRLARIEAKLDQVMDLIARYEVAQAKHNDLFYKSRDKVNDMESKSRGAWLAFGVYSGIISLLVSVLSKQ